MQVQGRHAQPLYFMGYIGSKEITRIQVDPGSALSIMPRHVMEHLSILAYRLSATDTNIFGFNANSTRPMAKIKLRCQIRDLKTEVTVYVIDADTFIQPPARAAMDPQESHCAVYPASSHEVRE